MPIIECALSKEWNNFKPLAKISTRYTAWFWFYSCKECRESTRGKWR